MFKVSLSWATLISISLLKCLSVGPVAASFWISLFVAHFFWQNHTSSHPNNFFHFLAFLFYCDSSSMSFCFQSSFSLVRREKGSFRFLCCLYFSLPSPWGPSKLSFLKVTCFVLYAVESDSGLMTPEQAVLKLHAA